MRKPQWKFPNISENEYMEDIIDCIPSLIILFKMLTGIGATTLEIEYVLRNSIIIEPNLPVIKGKCEKYNTKHVMKVRGVYENVTVDQIIEYLESSVTPKKIITTPESYFKVKQAFMELGIDIFSHSFMLFDECERAIQDVGYRAKILFPMNDFFKFVNKAFISATPIVPSDPKFALQGFEHVYIKPDFDIKQDLTLIYTNNIIFTFAKFIKENPRDQYFIFFKSTDTIAALITALKIKDESAVFCAKESKNKLKVNDFKHVHIDIAPFLKFNFFTSRFFSAVDIEDIPNPTIIIISDLISAAHSMVDPKSEAIQIIGRFRKIKDVKVIKEVIHITNTDENLVSKSEEQCLDDIKVGHRMYKTLEKFMKASTSPYGREVMKEVLLRIDFAKYLNFDGSANYFMQDNSVYEEKIKGYYQSIGNLLAAYDDSKNFNVELKSERYDFTDVDRLRTEKSVLLKTVFEVVMPVIKDIYETREENGFMWQYQLDTLKHEFPEVFRTFDKIGLEKAKELGFNHIKIRKAIKEKELSDQKTHFGFIQYIENNFVEGRDYSSFSIESLLKTGLQQNGLKLLNPGVKLLKDYCQLSTRKTIGRVDGKEIKGYTVIKIYNKLKP